MCDQEESPETDGPKLWCYYFTFKRISDSEEETEATDKHTDIIVL